MAAQDYFSTPADLPRPVDDGACAHLEGSTVPSVSLPSTDGSFVDITKQRGSVVVFCYPRTGRPGEALPEGWDEIPGARGTTCSIEDELGWPMRLLCNDRSTVVLQVALPRHAATRTDMLI